MVLKKKKKNLRMNSKRPELVPTMNLKGRQDYMDTGYIDGIYDEKGREVMRPLTDKEKDFLAQFYKETVNADKRNNKHYHTEEEWKDIYDGNNARNRCLLNHAKKRFILDSFTTKDGDKKFVKEIGDLDMELQIINGERDKKED